MGCHFGLELGAATLSIMTWGLMTVSIMTVSLMTLSIMTVSIKCLYVTLSIKNALPICGVSLF
jgi:hypothetical protein